MKNLIIIICLITWSSILTAQINVQVYADSAKTKISKHIYGHFAEHLGRCIYDGIYIGDNYQSIATTNGIRNDIIEALKVLQIPNLRWPGGCFADIYHWKDGIGPKDQRKHTENLAWGNVREDNSFGTHEFLNLCEELGAEPYLAINMNSGSVQEAMEWEQYVNNENGSSHLTDWREQNGRKNPWSVKYWGIGNESWDCGGNMTADYYVNLYKRYATALTSYDNTEKLYRIAVGPGWDDYNWTETIMKNTPAKRIEGLSVHHYSVFDWDNKGPSLNFTSEEYFKTMKRAWFMEEFISKNSEIMDKYDPDKKIGLIVDEWGGWYNSDPSANGQLYQQNTIRDAMIAGMTLNIFNNHADRVHMANLAQTVNVLQAVILTKGEKMILTPTYHVMNLYKVHQSATLVPVRFIPTYFERNEEKIPAISVSASIDNSGKMHISLTNIDDKKSQNILLHLNGFRPKSAIGKILTSERVQDNNSFEEPNKITPVTFEDFQLENGNLSLKMPSNSIILIEMEK